MIVLRFHEVGKADIHRVGGKGANLGEMARAGFPVPPGFCVTAEAYQRLIANANLWPAIESRLASVSPTDVAALEGASADIRRWIESAPVPPGIESAIREAYQSLDGECAPVAVRSSATAEDLPEASFAGQQDTYLGVRGADEVLARVRRCWASLWTGRAIAYRERNGFPHPQVSLAVVVQRMVEPDMSGVLFTANPITGKRDEMLVNAAYGLGEALVSGRVTPDTYRLSKTPDARVLEWTLGAKEIRIDSLTDGGTRTTDVPRPDRDRLCLDERRLRELTGLGMRVEALYGAPQDIEWAVAGERLYLLQSRPVTSLGGTARPLRERGLNRIERIVLDDILEHYPDPPYPLDYTAVTDGYQRLLDALQESGWAFPPAEAIIRMNDDGLASVHPVPPRPTRRMLGALSVVSGKLRLNPSRWADGQGPRLAAALDELRRTEVVHLNDESLAVHIEGTVGIAAEIGRIRFADYIAPMMIRGAVLKLLIRLAGGSRRINELDLLGDMSYKTVTIDRALSQLAAEADSTPAVRAALLDLPVESVRPALERTPEGRGFLERVTAFLDEHGARTMKVYLPFSNRSWAEDPTALMATLAALVRSGGAGDAEARARAASERFLRAREQVAGRLPGRLRRLFQETLNKFRAGHVAREATLYSIEESFAVARQAVREASRRLVTRGALPEADDARFLTLSELVEALRGGPQPDEVRRKVTRRRRARPGAQAAWRDRGPEPAGSGEDGLRGTPGSPGTATGAVKIIGGPGEFGKLQAGDVLVCPFTDPAWTPLFSLASAVVADTGGPLSHAAIVAREYGIPAVLGTRIATSRLRDGEVVTVDGDRGIVKDEG